MTYVSDNYTSYSAPSRLRPALFGPVMKNFFLMYKGRDGEKVKKQDRMRQ